MKCLIILESCPFWHVQITHTSLICNLSLFCCKLSPMLPFLDLDLKKIENNLFFLTSNHSCSFAFTFHLSSYIPRCNITCDKQNEGSLHLPCQVYIPSYYDYFVFFFFITNWYCWLIFSLLNYFSQNCTLAYHPSSAAQVQNFILVSVELSPILRPFPFSFFLG